MLANEIITSLDLNVNLAFKNILLFCYRLNMRHSTLILLFVIFVAVCKGATDEKNKDVGTVVGIDLGTTYSW